MLDVARNMGSNMGHLGVVSRGVGGECPDVGCCTQHGS
jgi:hypothetical protein